MLYLGSPSALSVSTPCTPLLTVQLSPPASHPSIPQGSRTGASQRYPLCCVGMHGTRSEAVANLPSIREQIAKIMDTNVMGAAQLTESMIPLLEKATSVPRIVFITSEMGSITNTLDPKFPYYSLHYIIPYKSSKAAENLMGASFAVTFEEKGTRPTLLVFVVPYLFSPPN
jgi:NAD(P)-dependent dehydrogenase (short-subunit alcohol dehydrogenase family)